MMTISTHSVRGCRKAIAMVGTMAAISVPVAQAEPQPQIYGALDPWAYSVLHRGQQATPQKYGPLDPWAYSVLHRSPQATARSVPPGPRSLRIVKPGGFDWRDAGIGAAASALGLMLLAGGMTLVARRHHAAPNRALAR
jgi:hypothetical protein